MSTTNEDRHVPHVHLPHIHRDSRHVQLDQEPPSANHFISIHESHIPWEGDAPIIHEDERYEMLEEEGIPKISEHFHIEHDPN